MKILVISLIVVFALAPLGGVYAHGGYHYSRSETESQSTQDSLTQQRKQALEQQKKRAELQREALKDQAENNREAADRIRERALEIEQEHESEDSAQKERKIKTCEARKVGLEKRLTNIQKRATKHKSKIDSYLTKATEYVEVNSITDESVNSALNSAVLAQTAATTSVEALNALSPAIDCTNSTAKSTVASFKAATEQARKDLKAYRISVKAVLETIESFNEGSQS